MKKDTTIMLLLVEEKSNIYVQRNVFQVTSPKKGTTFKEVTFETLASHKERNRLDISDSSFTELPTFTKEELLQKYGEWTPKIQIDNIVFVNKK